MLLSGPRGFGRCFNDGFVALCSLYDVFCVIFRLEYLCSIGDKTEATTLATSKAEDTSLTTNKRLDAVFALFRIAYFHGCNVKDMGKAIHKV